MWASWRCASFMCLGEQAASAAPGAESPRLVLQADLVDAGAHRAASAPPSAAVQAAKGAAAAHPPAQDGASTASAALRKAWPPSMREVGAQAGRRAVLGSARRTCRHVRYVPGELLLVCGARRRSFVRVGAPAVSEIRRPLPALNPPGLCCRPIWSMPELIGRHQPLRLPLSKPQKVLRQLIHPPKTVRQPPQRLCARLGRPQCVRLVRRRGGARCWDLPGGPAGTCATCPASSCSCAAQEEGALCGSGRRLCRRRGRWKRAARAASSNG